MSELEDVVNSLSDIQKTGDGKLKYVNPMADEEQSDAQAPGRAVARNGQHRRHRHARSQLVILAGRAQQDVWMGLNMTQLLFLVSSTVVPLADSWTDWLLILKWHYQLTSAHEGGGQDWDGGGDDGTDTISARWSWFLIALAIQLLSGVMTGLLLANAELDERFGAHRVGFLAYPVGMLAGLLGVAPLVEASIIVNHKYTSTQTEHGRANAADDDADDDELETEIWMLKSLRAVEIVVETLPQAFLQVSIGVMYGMLEPSSNNFDTLLFVSVCISLLSAGNAVLGMETEGRNKELALDIPPLSLFTKYGGVTALWRGCQTMALIFWGSLFQCAAPLPAVGLIFMLVGVVLFGKSMYEAAFERSLDRLDEHTSTGTRGAFLLGGLQFALVLTMALMFLDATGMYELGLGLDEEPNNYANTSATPQYNDRRSPQHRECNSSHGVLFTATWAMFMSPILMIVSLVLDPEHGASGVHASQVFDALRMEKSEKRFLTPSDFELDEIAAQAELEKVSKSAQHVQQDRDNTLERMRYARYVRATLNQLDADTKQPIHINVQVQLRQDSYFSTLHQGRGMISEDAAQMEQAHLRSGWRGIYAPSAEDDEHKNSWRDMSIASGGCPVQWKFDEHGAELGAPFAEGQAIPVDWWNILIVHEWQEIHDC